MVRRPIPVECPNGHPRGGWPTPRGVAGYCPPPCVGRFTWDPATGTATVDPDQPEPPPEPGTADWILDAAWSSLYGDLELHEQLAEDLSPDDLG